MQEIREYAPVLIPTLNRYEHFKRCVESLSRCTHADKTELIIGLDYPPSDKYREGWEKISSYVDTITGFKKITVLRAESNLGAIVNSRSIREYAKKQYQTYIYTEDDNEYSPCFLDYVDKALTRYWDDEHITSISGYNFPIDMGNYDKNIYAHHQYSAWGVGRWVHKFEFVQTSYANEIMRSPSKTMKILRSEAKILFVLMSMLAHKQRWSDALIVASNILKGRYSIFPSVSLCRNYGHDGSGLHCGGSEKNVNDIFRKQVISEQTTFDLDEIAICDANIPALKKYLGIPLKEALYDIKLYCKYLISK